MSPVGLGKLLAGLPRNLDPNLLVGFETSDDAAVYRLDDERALVLTADFITPPVDDPFLFGQIAAANSLSDVFAMGGRPIACLNLVGFPAGELGPEVLAGIVEGALTKITEAGAVLAGGHTTDDDEPKFGLSVTGIVHPDRYWRNSGAQPGDVLILTKPIGSGVLFNANLKKWVSEEALAACVDMITRLNKTASEVLQRFEVHAATDVTGFGLGGHAYEMATGSDVTLEIAMGSVPVMAEALEMYERGVSTGVNGVNRQNIQYATDFGAANESQQELLVDPQTSGGLLAALPEDQIETALAALVEAGVEHACVVGRVSQFSEPHHLIIK
ncbi:MAG TPA: selenide, water dikinase SelD [Candidatus Latescibacteria bacterium]|nr:selenide, water dikinase SelD [Candidatus Latescibacterota bacterium]HJP33694.1 selenide, water dikinase SelD [Candidatus Latescibacterota bacterium]